MNIYTRYNFKCSACYKSLVLVLLQSSTFIISKCTKRRGSENKLESFVSFGKKGHIKPTFGLLSQVYLKRTFIYDHSGKTVNIGAQNLF